MYLLTGIIKNELVASETKQTAYDECQSEKNEIIVQIDCKSTRCSINTMDAKRRSLQYRKKDAIQNGKAANRLRKPCATVLRPP